jgi:hypothetical protein
MQLSLAANNELSTVVKSLPFLKSKHVMYRKLHVQKNELLLLKGEDIHLLPRLVSLLLNALLYSSLEAIDCSNKQRIGLNIQSRDNR